MTLFERLAKACEPSDDYIDSLSYEESMGMNKEHSRIKPLITAMIECVDILHYCALDPRLLHAQNNAQNVAASNALANLERVLKEMEEK